MAELAATFYQNLRNGVEKGEFPLTPVKAASGALHGLVMVVGGTRPLTRRGTHEEAYTLTMAAVHDIGIGVEMHVDDPRAATQAVTQCGTQCDKYLVTTDSVLRLQHIGEIVSRFALNEVVRAPKGSQRTEVDQARSDLFDAYMALAQPSRLSADVLKPGQDPAIQNWAVRMNHEHVINDPVAYAALYALTTYPEVLL